MHPTMTQLHRDHFNTLRVLRCLESVLACYEIDPRDAGYLAIIMDIVDYLTGYPERFHHPVEELAFTHLLRKDDSLSELIWGMRAEHRTLEKLMHRMSELFISVANQGHVPLAQLVHSAEEVIERQLEHINRENRLIFPALEAQLGDADWAAITEEAVAARDPLFLERERSNHRRLYQHIIQTERGLAWGTARQSLKRRLDCSLDA